MRALPDNPNLDHLRRQAKDLLAGLRDSDPHASLTDAQASLAGQYGFATWTALKAEVDRLQDNAAQAAPDLARIIAERFGLGEVTGEMRSLTREDHVGRRWMLATSRGKWAAQNVDNVYPVSDGEADTALQLAAAAAGVTLPMPVRARGGAIVQVIDGHRWRVYQWRHSGPPLAAPVSAATTRTVGGILATLHGLRLPAEGICPWHSRRFTDETWADLAATAAAKDAPWAPTLADLVPALIELDEVGHGVTPPPPVYTKNGLLPADVRLGANHTLIVAGFEHAAGQPPVWELAEALTHWTRDPGGGINVAGARAMLAGYAAAGGSVPNLDLAAFRGTAISLANYLFGQVHLALTAEGEEDQRFTDRNIRHLLTTLSTRPTFERILDAITA
jgi:Ser/Thr protein kinase RdoA (MazF antagonist)